MKNQPLYLMERIVVIYSNVGDIVFDPFAGSGSTLIAAEKHGRIALGCDDESYIP